MSRFDTRILGQEIRVLRFKSDPPAFAAVDIERIKPRLVDQIVAFPATTEMHVLDDIAIACCQIENEDCAVTLITKQRRMVAQERIRDGIQSPRMVWRNARSRWVWIVMEARSLSHLMA